MHAVFTDSVCTFTILYARSNKKKIFSVVDPDWLIPDPVPDQSCKSFCIPAPDPTLKVGNERIPYRAPTRLHDWFWAHCKSLKRFLYLYSLDTFCLLKKFQKIIAFKGMLTELNFFVGMLSMQKNFFAHTMNAYIFTACSVSMRKTFLIACSACVKHFFYHTLSMRRTLFTAPSACEKNKIAKINLQQEEFFPSR